MLALVLSVVAQVGSPDWLILESVRSGLEAKVARLDVIITKADAAIKRQDPTAVGYRDHRPFLAKLIRDRDEMLAELDGVLMAEAVMLYDPPGSRSSAR
jgi:hypothetical protein